MRAGRPASKPSSWNIRSKAAREILMRGRHGQPRIGVAMLTNKCLSSVCVCLVFSGLGTLLAQQSAAPAAPQPKTWTTEEDHRNMMEQLGIRKLRPGPSGNENAPNHANYDEALANPFPNLPDVLTLKDGKKVTSAQIWWDQRRPEIVEDFEREVFGRVPPNVPKVLWSVAEEAEGLVGTYPVVEKLLVGHVDNSSYPAISVDIQMTLVTPTDATGPVPVMMMFGFGALPRASSSAVQAGRGFGQPRGGDPPATQQLIAGGWGYASIIPMSVQADNGAGLTKGIIGLVNKGQPRRPDDWGALRPGMGRVARLGLPGDGQGGGCQTGWNRGGLALRQGGPCDHGIRHPIRAGPGRLFR